MMTRPAREPARAGGFGSRRTSQYQPRPSDDATRDRRLRRAAASRRPDDPLRFDAPPGDDAMDVDDERPTLFVWRAPPDDHEVTPAGPRELTIETHDYEAHESTMVLPFEDTHACLLQSLKDYLDTHGETFESKIMLKIGLSRRPGNREIGDCYPSTPSRRRRVRNVFPRRHGRPLEQVQRRPYSCLSSVR